MSTTTFSSTSGGSGSDFDITVSVSGVTGTVTQIEFEATLSAFDQSGLSLDVVDPDGTSHSVFTSGTLTGSGSTTQTHIVASLPVTTNGTYTFEFFDFTGFANPIVNSGDCKVKVTTGSSGTNSVSGLGSEVGWWCPSISGNDPDQENIASPGTYDISSTNRSSSDFATDTDEGGTLAAVSTYTTGIGGQNQVSTGIKSQVFDTGGWTMTGWVKSTSPTNTQHLYDTDGGWVFRMQNGVFRLLGGINFTTTTTVPSNQWFHFAMSVDSNRTGYKFYLDGVLEETHTDGAFPTSGQDAIYICAQQNATYHLAGRWDDFRLFNSELTSDEVAHLATSRGVLGSPNTSYQLEVDDADCASEAETSDVTVVRFPQAISGLYAWYCASLNQDVSSGVDDLSGNDRHMTISGTLSVVSESGSGGTHAYDDTDSVEAIHDINGYFSHSDSLIGGFTCSYWVKFDSSSGDAWPVGFQGQTSPPSSSYRGLSAGIVRDDSGASTVFRAALASWLDSDSSIEPDFTQLGSISSGTWHHILITGGSAQYLYVNGVYQGGETGLWSYGASQHDKLWLGCDGESLVDDVRYWDRELTASEVSDLYNGGRTWGAVPISLEVDSVSASSECSSFEVTTKDLLLVESVESVPRVFAQQVCVHQMVGLSTSEEVFWYYPEYNSPNGYDLSPNYNLRNHAGGVQANLSNANMWGFNDIVQQSRDLYANPYAASGRQYVDLQRKFFDQTSGSFSVSYRFGLTDFGSMVDSDEYWLFGCGTDLNPNFGTTSANGFKVWITAFPARTIKVVLTFKNQEFGSNGDPEFYKNTFSSNLQVNESSENHLVVSLDAQQSLIVNLNGTSSSTSLQFTYAGSDEFQPHMPDDWHLGAVNEDLSKKDFFGTIYDFRGYNKVLSASEISELSSGGKGTQLVCDAGNPNAPVELEVSSAESHSLVSDFELRPFELIAASVDSSSLAASFYVLPIGLGDIADIDSPTEASSLFLSGAVQLEVDSAESKSLAKSIFTLSSQRPLLAESCEAQSQSQAILVPVVSKSISVDSSDAKGEAEAPYMPLSPNQKLVTARSVQCASECSRPNVSESGSVDAYLIYCPSRSYDYIGTGSLPDLSGNHSPTSQRNDDILWEKVDQEWAIDMRSTSPFSSSISNGVEIKPDPSESINNFGSPASAPDVPFSISMHFMFDQWPQQYGNTTNKNTCMGLYNFVVLQSAEGDPIDYFEDVSAGVRVYVVRSYNEASYRIHCQLLKPSAAYWTRRYSDELSATYELQANRMHHLVVTYDGNGSSGIRLVLNNNDITGATTGTISSPPYSPLNSYSEFAYPTTLRKAFIGRTNGIYPYQSNSYEGTQSTRDTRGEAVPFWDDFRYFREELNDDQIQRLLTRGVDLPARFELEIDNAGAIPECEALFCPVAYDTQLPSLDSSTELSEIFTVGFNYLIDADDARSFTRVESPTVIRHKGVPADSVDLTSESSSPDVTASRSTLPSSLLASSGVSRPAVSKNLRLAPQSVSCESIVFSPSLSGDGEVSVLNAQSASESEEVDVSRNLYLSPASIDSPSSCSASSLSLGAGLLVSGSDSPSECESPQGENLGVHLVFNLRNIESSTETESVFFFSDKAIEAASLFVLTESEQPSLNIGTSLSEPLSVDSPSEAETFGLVASTSLEIDSSDSISESSDASLDLVLSIEAHGVDVGTETESPYVSLSPLRAASVECTAEVKGFTLPDLSKVKTGTPRLFLISDLIIGDY